MTKPISAKQRRRARQIARRRRVLLLLLIVAAIISICLFTPFFNVKTIELVGNEVLSTEQLLTAVSIPEDINIFALRKGLVKKALLQFPEIESVRILRKLPSKIQIQVTETKPIMYFSYKTGYAITNENGKVLSLTDTAEELNLLLITGLEIKNAEICKKISVQDTVKFDIILDTIQKFNQAELVTEIKSCHFDNLSELHMFLTDGTKIILGNTEELDYKISVLKNILPRVNRAEGAYIDLTTPSRAVYGILEPEPTPSPEPSSEPEEEVKPEQNETDSSTSNAENDESKIVDSNI